MYYYLFLAFDSPELIVWSACIGIIIAMIISYAIKSIEGTFISNLLSVGANTEEAAITIFQAGQKPSPFLKFFLRDGSTLRKTVSLVGDTLPYTKKGSRRVPLFENARFYISSEKADKAESISKGRIKWYFIPPLCVLIVIITIIVIELLPILTSI